MKELSSRIANEINSVFGEVVNSADRELSKTRYLPGASKSKSEITSFERLADSSLLKESLKKTFKQLNDKNSPVVLFMDRKGGSEEVKVAESVIELLSVFEKSLLIYMPFITPRGGLGTLMQSALARKGASAGVLVDVVPVNMLARGLHITLEQAKNIVSEVDIAITYAPEGFAGLMPYENELEDALVSVSSLNILSFPDGEYTVADIPRFKDVIEKRPSFNHIEFTVELIKNGSVTEHGRALLGEGGDAEQRLWTLLDSAKREQYMVLATPVVHGVPVGEPLFMPCESLLKEHLSKRIEIDKIVKAGNSLIAVGRGLNAASI
ncbi:MAG: hypothetical protein JXR91_02230 [Deltaproteobacteria bacterium]|nr:hypothetical protein [Deltaproteobacteria bacterium]